MTGSCCSALSPASELFSTSSAGDCAVFGLFQSEFPDRWGQTEIQLCVSMSPASKAGFWVKSLLYYQIKLSDFLSQHGNRHNWARPTTPAKHTTGKRSSPTPTFWCATADGSRGCKIYKTSKIIKFHLPVLLMPLSACAASVKQAEGQALQRRGKAKPVACLGWAKALFLRTHLLLLHCWHWGHPCFGEHFFLCLTQRAPWFWSSLFFVAVFQVLSAIHKGKNTSCNKTISEVYFIKIVNVNICIKLAT